MKYMTVYKDVDTGAFYTRYDLECDYDNAVSEHDGSFDYDDFSDFLECQKAEGNVEEITATLSDGAKIYPFYYVEEDHGFMTVEQLYILFREAWKEEGETFADFLANPSIDRNGLQFYGFE